MRLFVAFDLPEDVRQEVSRLVAAAKPELPRARWVRSEAMHLTLRFLGETDPSRLGELGAGLRQAFAPWRPIDLQVAGAGAFPSSRRGRVLWMGIRVDETLAKLQAEVESAVTRVLGLEPEKRPFSAHLTLARANPPWPRGPTEEFIGRFETFASAEFQVTEGTLFESQLSPKGARYRVVETYPLEGEG